MISLLTPSWEQQLGRRGIELTLSIASNLPSVLSDPSRLEPMLGGLVDRCSRGLPSGSQLVLTLNQLELVSSCNCTAKVLQNVEKGSPVQNQSPNLAPC